MCHVPMGAEVKMDPAGYPLVKFKNIFILPGVPEFFSAKFSIIADQFLTYQSRCTRKLLLKADETTIAAALNVVVKQNRGVSVGSYPRSPDTAASSTSLASHHHTIVTMEASSHNEVRSAMCFLQESLPAHIRTQEEDGDQL
ncbi:hypothetical protein CYMTET_30838 [Cymbomonas tetramitiformis]|uniref:FAD synthase middle domain-containing protein n=1 Tax=Cymbomonas tetramitiformis TaxID=36881 RepID=A0AAE0FIN6_9CHLO|nr:hypothetical protein CYMTET_30838 [Cymbomonas tetramitiformis]